MMNLFRLVALVEGVTTLALFFVAMPLKYILGNPVLVPSTGMAHGIAFIAYILVMIPVLVSSRATVGGWLRTTLAAFVPLGTFINDSYLRLLQRRRRSMGFN
ncbi:hypothetical protein D3C85_419160 [compost metagenome]